MTAKEVGGGVGGLGGGRKRTENCCEMKGTRFIFLVTNKKPRLP